MSWRIEHGGSEKVMAEMEANSIDAIVCDPPYGLEFMGKAWDRFADEDPIRRSGHESADSGAGFTPTEKGTLPSFGGRWTFECEGCGRRDAFARASCRCEGGVASWRRVRVDGGSTLKAFQNWCEMWATQALRVLKPGGYLLAFGGTRTYHRLASGIEDAGFDMRDEVSVFLDQDERASALLDTLTDEQRRAFVRTIEESSLGGIISWVYGVGFPKNRNVGELIDAELGAEREDEQGMAGEVGQITEPATPEAERWEGWGTALKPAHEPVVVARKPFAAKTIAGNVLAHGVGVLNVPGCTIPHSSEADLCESQAKNPGRDDAVTSGVYGADRPQQSVSEDGRHPPNVMLAHHEDCRPIGSRVVKGDRRTTGGGRRPGGFGDDVGADPGDVEPNAPVYGDELITEYECVEGCPVATLNEQSGDRKGSPREWRRGEADQFQGIYTAGRGRERMRGYGDRGGASRFFYTAKASTAEREAGLHDFEPEFSPTMGNGIGGKEHDPESARPKLNPHPTVKPVDVMRWLVRLVTPPGGTVLDPFAGSGTTGIAAVLEGLDFVGVEREADYVRVAEARIEWWDGRSGDTRQILAAAGLSRREAERREEAGQLGLLDVVVDESEREEGEDGAAEGA